jgi:hypothetical protein
MSREICETLAMALLKRRKRKLPKPLPGRELRCGECGAPILADDLQGIIPSYTCPECGASYPTTRDQDIDRQVRLDVAETRAKGKKDVVDQRKSAGLPAVWVERLRTTPKQRAAAREVERREEGEIIALLSKESYPRPRGRKADPTYDKAAYQAEFARLRGKKIPLLKQAKELLKHDKSSNECKRLRLKQALRRRR